MQELYSYRDLMLQRYSKVGEEVKRAAQAISKSAWHTPLEGTTSSHHQIIARLHAQETQLFNPCIDTLLDGDEKSLPLFDVNEWLQAEYQCDISIESILTAYLESHTEMNVRLQNLLVDAWIRVGRHLWWGCRTLQWWVESSLAEANKVVGYLCQFQQP